MSPRSVWSLSATLFLVLSSLAAPGVGAPSSVSPALVTEYQPLNGLGLLALDFHFLPHGLGSTLLEGATDKALLPAQGTLEDWSDPNGLDTRWTRTGSFKVGAIKANAGASWDGADSKHVLVAGNGPGRAISAPFTLDGTAQAISYEIGSMNGSGTNYLVLQVQKNGKWQDQIVAKETASIGVKKGKLEVAGITDLVRLVLATTKGGMVAGRLNTEAGKSRAENNQGEGSKDGQSPVGETVETISVNGAELKNVAKPQPVSHSSPYTEFSRFLQRVDAVLSTTVTAPETKSGILRCYAMVPPDLETQKLVNCSISCPEVSGLSVKKVGDSVDPNRSYLLLEVPISSQTFSRPITININYVVDLYHVHLEQSVQPNEALIPFGKVLTADLSATATLDYQSPSFQAYLKTNNLLKHNNENNFEFAYRAFQIITDELVARTRPFEHTDSDKFKLSMVCSRASTDDGCGCCSLLFTGTMRANDVPSRLLVGRWAHSTENGDGMFHVRSDFYEPSIGWIPVDQTFSVLEKRKVERDYNRDFGLSSADFLTFHLNSDVSPVADDFHMPVHQFGIISYKGNSPYHPAYSESWKVLKL